MTVPNTTTRIAFYARVSRAGKRSRADLDRHTLAAQRDAAEAALLKSEELVVDDRYVDVNVSGTHSQRPGLQALFDDVENGLIDGVVVGYLSRFGRNVPEALENIERLHDAGATFISAKDSIRASAADRDVYGKFIITVLSAVAAMEADRLAEQLADSNGRAIAQGISISVPYGYVRENGPGSVLVPDTSEDNGPAPADVVRRIFALRLEGQGASAIAALLNGEGVPCPSQHAYQRGLRERQVGQRWAFNTIQNIVQTHTYKGVIPRWQTEDVGKGKRRRRVAGTVTLLPGEHDALVDERTWARAQFDVRPAVRNGASSNALLQGLVRCRNCSQTMTPSKGGNGRTVYKCRGTKVGCSQPTSISREALDAYVERVLYADDGIIGAMQAAEAVDTAALDDLDARIDELDAQVVALRDHGDPADPDYWPAIRSRRRSMDELRRQRGDLARQATRSPIPSRDAYAALSVAQRRVVLSDTLDAIVVSRAPGRGRMGELVDRVAFVPFGQSPIELSRSGVPVAARVFPLEADDEA